MLNAIKMADTTRTDDVESMWQMVLKTEFDVTQIDNLSKSYGFQILLVQDRRGFSVLHWAIILGITDLVLYLLNKGVPVDLKVKIKEEPLPIHLAALEGRLRIIDILIKYGTDVNATDKKGCTPLMRAAMFGMNVDTRTADTVLFLLSRGANPKTKDNIGFTALHYATFFGREDAVSLLLTIGIDANQRDKDGFKPLDIALHMKNRYLIEELAAYTLEAQNGQMDMIIKRCSRRKLRDYFDLLLVALARIFVLFFVITTLFWSYPQYIFHYLPGSKDLWAIHVAILISSTSLWVCWYRAMRKSPGRLPIDSQDYYDVLEYKLNLTDRNKMHQVIPDDIFKDAQLCHICRTLQPARSRHCRFCKRCTEMFDHHCMYLSNCVGKRNRLSFFCLIFHLLFVGSLYLSLILLVMRRNDWTLTYQHLTNLAFALKLIAIGGILTICTIRRAMINLTTNEELRKDSYKYLKNQNGNFHNKFDRGSMWTNLKDYFKTSTFFINPNPSRLFGRNRNFDYQPLRSGSYDRHKIRHF